MTPKEVGEFKVDQRYMDKKLAAERKLMWKHRRNVVWRYFGRPTATVAKWCVGIYLGVKIPLWIISTSSFLRNAITQHPRPDEAFVLIWLAVTTVEVVVGITALANWERIVNYLRDFKREWNQNSISGRY